MKWVPDKTGRFAQRPHYLPEELDAECEQIVGAFLRQKYGRVEFPITTDDLTVLIEQKADLDSYADLSGEEGEVEGVTEFTRGERPTVRISTTLAAPHLENRLRTTLTHEWGHVHFHQSMFEVETRPHSLFGDDARSASKKCKRDNIVGASETDWMEWQAGYVCGAVLMPAGPLIDAVRAFRRLNGLALSNLMLHSDAGQKLIETVAGRFQTSRDAARVRLLKKRILIDSGLVRAGDILSDRNLF